MKDQKQDRRIRRTQKLLKDSLIELMQEKEFKNISVKDITERADLNRGTFYLHYRDTYHLLQEMEEDVLGDFQEMIDCYKEDYHPATLMPVLVPVVDYIEKNSAICKIMFENSASNDFVDRFHKLIHQNGQELIDGMFPDARQPITDAFFEFVTYGLIGMLKHWLDTNRTLPKDELAQLADKAVIGTAARLLAGKPV